MRKIINSRADLLNMVDDLTSGWDNRTWTEVVTITDNLLSADHCPRYGTDWSEYIDSFDFEGLVS